MHPNKVIREKVKVLTDLPNIGPAMAEDLRKLGITQPQDLCGRSALDLYTELCIMTGQRHDPCVLDTFMSIIDFMAGAPPRPWWEYTPERKRVMQSSSLNP